MKLDSKKMYEFLESIGISHLYHSNTVPTACTFINEGGLLSRGAVEAKGLVQTPQNSDDIDKQFNVWNDIFLDCNDLHVRFGRENRYGPVLFKLRTEFLLELDEIELWVTRDNPIRWSDEQTESDRYFQSIEELMESYTNKSYVEMITLRFQSSPLSFRYLEEIILDNPKVRIGELNLYKAAAEILKKALIESEYEYSEVTRTTRDCVACYCHSNYLRQYTADKLKMIFKGYE